MSVPAPLLPTRVFRGALVRAAALPFALVVGLGVGLWLQVRALLVASARVEHTERVLNEVAAVQARILDMEARTRGFLLHGDPAFLSPPGRLVALRAQLRALEDLVSDDPAQVARTRLLQAEVAGMERYHEAARALGPGSDAAALVRTRGHALREALTRTTDLMLAEEVADRDVRADVARRAARRARAVTVALAGGFGLLAAGLTSWEVVRLGRTYGAALSDLAATSGSLAASEQSFRVLVDAVQDYAIFFVDVDGRIASWNVGAERLTGWRADEVVGEPLSTLYVDEDLTGSALARELEQARTAGRYETEGLRRRKDGSSFWAQVSLAPLRDDRGALRGYVKVTRDVTERRRAAEELERRVEERTRALRDANEELEAFGYSVSHDLRAPLRSMHGFAEAIIEDCAPTTPGCREYAGHIVDAADRMEQLIADLLGYARLGREAVTVQPVALRSVVDEALEPLRARVERTRAQVEVSEDLGVALAHRPTLVLSLQNLLENALKFVAPGQTPRVTVRAEDGGERVRLWVEDRGIGIAPEHQARVFRVFERLHGEAQYPGTGIGLAIVRRAVQRMEGRVLLESTPGRGSRFGIELAAVAAPREPAAASSGRRGDHA